MRKITESELRLRFGEPLVEYGAANPVAINIELWCDDCNAGECCGNCGCCVSSPELGDRSHGKRGDMATHLRSDRQSVIDHLSEVIALNINEEFGTRIGEIPGIKKASTVGARDDRAKPRRRVKRAKR